MLNLPDKLVYKTTVTEVLRKQICNLPKEILARPDLTYLEIGFDIGLTMLSVKDNYSKLTGVDIDDKRVRKAQELSKAYCTESDRSKLNFLLGNSANIPPEEYDVVLIDAGHDYDNVKRDFENLLEKNQSKNYIVFFHDYGLDHAGVKKFVHEKFDEKDLHFCGLQNDWNPHGGSISDWEAVYVVVRNG